MCSDSVIKNKAQHVVCSHYNAVKLMQNHQKDRQSSNTDRIRIFQTKEQDCFSASLEMHHNYQMIPCAHP